MGPSNDDGHIIEIHCKTAMDFESTGLQLVFFIHNHRRPTFGLIVSKVNCILDFANLNLGHLQICGYKYL